MNVLIISNPNSGQKKTQKDFDTVVGRLFIEGVIEKIKKIETTPEMNYQEAIQSYPCDLIVALGGDGTLNKVVTGMIQLGITTPLLIVPAGTVNDFASYIGIPSDVDGLIKVIKDFALDQTDVFKCNDRYFVNVFGAGMMTDVAYKTPDAEKNILGRFAYYLHGLSEVPKQIYQSPKFKLYIDEQTLELECLVLLILNTRAAGGFTQIAPKASMNDGLFDVCIIKKSDVLKLADVFIKTLSGDHIKDNQVIYYQSDHIKIEAMDESVEGYDIDGEYGGKFPVEISIAEQKMTIVVNADKKE